MTLFKQIVILLSLFVLVLLLTILSLNFTSAEKYVQDQLYTDAQDTAASLSLSLGSAQGDNATMATMVNAVFDSGYYRLIVLSDMEGNELYRREAETVTTDDVPQWFMDFVTLEVPTASAQVSSGWNPVAILEVTSLETPAYEQLFATSQKLLIGFTLLCIVTFALLYLLLHIVLKSVKRVQQQAEAITKNDFITNENIPFTTEFKDATLAMNAMVLKVKAIFTKEAKTLKQYHKLLYKDPVTDLANRRLFVIRLGEYLRSESKKSEGLLFFIGLDGLDTLNDSLGHDRVDALLKAFGTILSTIKPRRGSTLAVRLNGTEFALLVPAHHDGEYEPFAKELNEKTETLFIKEQIDTLKLYTSVIEYHAKDSLTTIFSRADYGLAKCRQQSPFSVYFEQDDTRLDRLGKNEWSKLIAEALKEKRLELTLQPVICDGTSYHEEAYLRLLEKNGTSHSAGSFMPMAHALEMDIAIDKYIIEKVVTTKFNFEHSIAINLSSAFVKESASLQWLSTLLQENSFLKPLYFELSNNDLLASLESCALFSNMLRQHGHYFGIDKFTVYSSDLSYLQRVKPAYIKVDQGYLTDIMISHATGIENNALHIIMESLDITLIATGVDDEESKKRMRQIGVKCLEGCHIAKRYDIE